MQENAERASARAGKVCPNEKFASLARLIDQAESFAWDRIGGPTDAECAAIRRLEVTLPAPSSADDWRWLAARFGRALANEWGDDAAGRMIELARSG